MRRTTHEASALSSTRSHQVMFLLSANTNCNWDDGAFALSPPPSSLHPFPPCHGPQPGPRDEKYLADPISKAVRLDSRLYQGRGGARGTVSPPPSSQATPNEGSSRSRSTLRTADPFDVVTRVHHDSAPPIYFATVTIRIRFYKVKRLRARFSGIRGLSITEGEKGWGGFVALLGKFKSLCSFGVVDIWRLYLLLDCKCLWKFVSLLCRDLVDPNIPLNILFQRFWNFLLSLLRF